MNSQPDVMARLEAARPAHLDPALDPHRRRHDLARALGEPRSLAAARTRRPVGRPAGIAFGLTAAAAVAAIAVVTATGSGTPQNPLSLPVADGAKAEPTTLTASQVLLLAADHVRTAATTGRYWRTTTDLYSLELAGPAKDPYVVRSGDREQDWVGGSASHPGVGGSKGLGRTPATAADRAAWKRDGSPTTLAVHGPWVTPTTKVGPGKDVPDSIAQLSAKPTPWTVSRFNPDSKPFFVGHDLTMKDVRALPSDPAALRAFLLTDYQRNIDAQQDDDVKRGPAWTTDTFLFSMATDLLTLPVDPAVRASAYRIMAGLDGVKSLGSVQDVAGRTGSAVAVQRHDSLGTYEFRLIIDPSSGLLLADETRFLKTEGTALNWLRPGDVYAADVVRQIGWTNAKPPAVTPYVPSGHGVG